MEKDKIVAKTGQSEILQKERERVIRLIQEDRERRDRPNIFFRNTNLIQYTDISLQQFLGYRTKPEWKKDYQFNIFDPITRDKVMAIISKTGGMFEAEFFNTNKKLNKVSETITTVLSAFYKDSCTKLDDHLSNRALMLDALTSPKAIWYEGWRYQPRTIRDIIERDEAGRVTKTAAKKVMYYNGPWGETINVKDIIPGSLKQRKLQEQPRFTWIPKYSIEDFKRMFPVSKYPEAAKVQAHRTLIDAGYTDWLIRPDLRDNEVEVAHLYEKWDDKLTIIANGIMLTPVNSPMPFAHKDYPFTWGGFEENSNYYIYDMPLTMKLLDMQDMTNEVWNLTLDMIWRALNEVILSTDGDSINDDVLYGGGIVEVDDPKNYQKLEFGSSFAFNSANTIIERAKRSIESSSLDAPTSGQSGTRQITAREVMVAKEAAMEITTLFLQNMEAMEKQKAILRVKNQLDRYKNPIDWKSAIGDELTGESLPIFRELSVRNTKLDGGKRGVANIKITDKPRSKKEVDKENIQDDKVLSQTIDISPDLIRDITFDVEIVPNSSTKKSKALQVAESRALLMDSVQMPDVLNVKNAAKEYVKALGKKESDHIIEETEAMPGQETGKEVNPVKMQDILNQPL